MSFNRGWTYHDRIRLDGAGLSVSAFYASRYSHSSAAEWAARAESGEILLNGRRAAPGDILAAGDELLWRRPPWSEGVFADDIPIIYQDECVVAVDKPAGISTMPDGGWLENSLVGWLDRRFGKGAVAPAHRLNRGTSGIVICGRGHAARAALAHQFLEKTESADEDTARAAMDKIYLARTIPCPAFRPGHRQVVEVPIGEVAHPVLGLVFAAAPNGLRARSECELVECDGVSALWRVRLVTGRPHQIRIHLAAIGAPLLGEPLFLPGGRPSPFALPGGCGYFLRAVRMTFAHPGDGRPVTLEVPALGAGIK